MGQVGDALNLLPVDPELKQKINWLADLECVRIVLKKYTKTSDGYGITTSRVSDDSKIAWDVYQVIRKKLSWERAVEDGDVESEQSPRNWEKMISVHYDDPFKTGLEPLAEIVPNK